MEWVAQFTRSKDGTRIAYGVVGEGRPLVYLGPAGLSHIELYPKEPDGRRTLAAFSNGRMLVRLDFRGTGMSARDAADLSPEAVTDDLEAVIDTLNLESVDIFATVIRVTPAIRLAVRRPGLVRRMVLSSPFTAGEQAAPGMVPLAEGNWDLFVETMAMRNADERADVASRVAFMKQCFDQRNIVSYSRASLPLEDWAIAERVQCPVLIVDDQGSLAVPGHTAAFAARFPTGRLVHAPRYHTWNVPPEVFQFLDEPADPPPQSNGSIAGAGTAALTAREREILALLVAGLTQPEIAERLVIAPATVSRHVVSLYAKLGVHRRAEAVVWAVRHGIT